MHSGFRDRVEDNFESWGRFVSAHPKRVLIASLLVALAFAAGLPRLYVDVTFEAFLGQDDEVRIAYEAFRERFGRDERIIVAVEASDTSRAADASRAADDTGTAGVFTKEFLERLRSLHEALETRVPHIVEVTSLINARDTYGDGDTLRVEDFLDPWPEDAAAIADRRSRALSNPLFLNNTISLDGRVTAMVIELELYSSVGHDEDTLEGFESDFESDGDESPPPLLTGDESAEVVRTIRQIAQEFDHPEFRVRLAGSPVMLQTVAESMFHDMPRFVGLAIASIAALLFLLFRRVVAVVVPIIVVVLSVLSTLGLMGWAGAPVHVPTQILPSFLLAVGVGDAVHLMTIFFERLRSGDARDDALSFALGHSGLALVLTSITTAAGLASFATSGISPIANVGLFAPIGVMIALFLSLTLLPALLTIAPLGSAKGLTAASEPTAVDRMLGGFGSFATQHRWGVVGGTALLTVVAVLAASRINLSHDPLSWLDQESQINLDTRFIDEHLGGSVNFEILLETEPGGVRRPAALQAMERLGESFEREPRDGYVAGQTISLADVVKEINRALNSNAATAYAIPDDDRLVAQELLLFENTGSDDLEDLTDSQYETARITVRMPWDDAVQYTPFFDQATSDTANALDEYGDATLTGALALLVRAITALVTSMVTSYIIAFLIIAPIMVLLLGNLKMGLLAMIPNTLPILLTLGLMGAFGFPLDGFSLMVGGIALGLAVDDTIHFMHNYRRYRQRGMSLEDAVHETLHTTGRAMLITTIVLSVGFLGFLLSSMVNLSNLGLLVAFAISSAFLADVLLAPALLAIFDERRE